MQINKITVHEVVKEQHKPVGDNNIRPNLIELKHHTAAAKLLSAVTEMYGTKVGSCSYGIFEEEGGGGSFPTPAKAYLVKENPSDQEFQALTKTAMDELKRLAARETLATGGYILFADYTVPAGRYIVVVMFKQKAAFRITDLSPEELMTLDTSRIYQAARLSFNKFKAYEDASPEDRFELQYLSFVSPVQARNASGYFIDALGCKAGSSAKQTTAALIKESVDFIEASDELRPYAGPFRDALMDYLNERVANNTPVVLDDIGEIYRQKLPVEMNERADELVDAFITRLNSEDVGVPNQFYANREEVRSNTRIKAQGTGWKVEFDRVKLGSEPDAAVYFNEDSQTLTLSGLPERMVDAIKDALRTKAQKRDENA